MDTALYVQDLEENHHTRTRTSINSRKDKNQLHMTM